MAKPNPGNHLFLQVGDDVCARVPLKSRVITPDDDIVDAILEAIDHAEGVTVDDGDLVLVSEKALSISQGNALPVADIRTSRAARLLSRYVSRTPVGVGLGHPATMQLAIDEVGLRRILLAAAATVVTRPFGIRGVFYRVAGRRVNAIDGPSSANLPPYDSGPARRRPTATARYAALPPASQPAPATRWRSRSSTPTTSRPRCSPPRPASTPKRCVRSSSTTRSASRPSRRRSGWCARLPSSSSVRTAQTGRGRPAAIRANTSALVEHVGSDVHVMAMVKSNGYGHGIRLAAEAAIAGGATWLGVASSTEALDVSSFGVPVLIVGRGDPGSHEALVGDGIETTVYDDEGVETLASAAASVGRRARAHVKVDTGMGRLGVGLDRLGDLLRVLGKYSSDVEIAGVFTNFADSDATDLGFTEQQHDRFVAAVDDVRAVAPDTLAHCSNSGAILRAPHMHHDLVRPGIALYGYAPDTAAGVVKLRLAMTMLAPITQVKTVDAGTPVGYGRTWTAPRRTRVATVAAGYADGVLPRSRTQGWRSWAGAAARSSAG